MDFMNLNQSAHGDREFGFMATRMGLRRKTVVGHWSDPAVVARIGTWTRAACGWDEAQRLEVARFGDNMRRVAVTEGDKVEAQLRLGVSVNGYGVGELVEAVRAVPDAAVQRARGRVRRGVRPRAGAARGRRAARVPARRRPDRGGPALVPRGRRLHGLHGHVRGPRRASPAAGDRGAAPAGRRLRLRRRGRLEDRGARPRRQGDEHRPRGRHLVHGGLHVPPGARRAEGARRPHARGLPVDRGREAAVRDPSAVDRREGGSGAPGLHRRSRAGGRRRPARPRRPVPPRPERGRRGRAGRGSPAAAGGARALGAAARPGDRRRGVARRGRPAPHGVLPRDRTRGVRGPRRDRRASSCS